jgi:hypothetical protein
MNPLTYTLEQAEELRRNGDADIIDYGGERKIRNELYGMGFNEAIKEIIKIIDELPTNGYNEINRFILKKIIREL